MSLLVTWIIVFLVFTIIEIITINLVTIWFAIGAISAAIASLITDSVLIQLTVFFVISTIALAVTKPLKDKLTKNTNPTNLDRIIGMTGIVTEDIEEDEVGEIKVDGKRWSAISEDNQCIKKGQKVEILEIKSTKLKVKEIKGVKN